MVSSRRDPERAVVVARATPGGVDANHRHGEGFGSLLGRLACAPRGESRGKRRRRRCFPSSRAWLGHEKKKGGWLTARAWLAPTGGVGPHRRLQRVERRRNAGLGFGWADLATGPRGVRRPQASAGLCGLERDRERVFLFLFFSFFQCHFQMILNRFLISVKNTQQNKFNAPARMHKHIARLYDEF